MRPAATKELHALYSRHARHSLLANKATAAALAVLLILSAFLMATGAMVMERLLGSIDQLFDAARPPHFLQMHKGEFDRQALARFASSHPEISAWTVEEMLGFDGGAVTWQRPATGEAGDLADSLIENLVVMQNEEFDFLLDETGAVPYPSPGEVYVPVAHQQRYGLRVGDELAIATESGRHELRIRGFVRDAQMASSLSAATRFLVSEPDFRALERAGGGAPEILVAYRLSDPSLTAQLQSAYESDDALPTNGQAVTLQMIRMINAFSDGLVAVALILVSLLLVTIAMLNLRFVIRGTVEDEVREIGAMKAIGLPDKAITRLYLAKYRVLTLLACLVGGALAVLATRLLTRSIQASYAEAPVSPAAVLVPVVALALVYLVVIAICRGSLRAVRKIQVVGALVHGSTLDERQTVRRARREARGMRRSGLSSYRGGNLRGRLALLDLRAEAKQWVLVPLVFFITAVLITLPTNLLSTFESPRFVTYMGAPESDLRADLHFTEDVDTLRGDMLRAMQADARLTDVRVLANERYETPGETGAEILRVETGDRTSDAIAYVQGGSPGPGEIALSYLNADRYRAAVGDEMTLRQGDASMPVTVSGIYQDVTSGGFTAKTHGEVTSGASSYVIYANTADGVDPARVAAEYGEAFPKATVIPMREYVQQMLSFVTDALRSAALLSVTFGIGVAALITVLFLKLRLARDRRRMGVLSAIGFSTAEIIAQVRSKTLLAATLGTLLGLGFAATAGESLVGLVISAAGLGIADLTFIPDVPLVYVAYPLALVAAGYLGAVVLTARLRSADKSTWLS